MKKAITIFLLAAVGVAFGGPVRSALGGRHAQYVPHGEESPNPYVTDSLIAMWDGENNAGWGLHDASATTWIDLSGRGNNAVLSQWATWTDNAIVCDGTHYAALVSPDGIASVLHCEIVYERIQTTYGYLCYWADTKMGSSGNPLKCQLSFKNSVLMIGKGQEAVDGAWKDTYFPNVPLSGTLSANFRYGRMWINGAEISSSSGFEAWGSVTLGEIGGRAARTGNVYKGKILCIRLYSRPLTESEITSNYIVDQTRFGL